MSKVRFPAVSGLFYPSEPDELHAMVRGFLKEAQTDEARPKALIAPHAGYVYSGPVAASAYARLLNGTDEIERVVLLGPSHRVGFYGLAATGADYYEMPFGRIPVDREATEKLLHLPQIMIFEAAHAEEHSLEVHLPFLQETLGVFKLVPLVVGGATDEEVAEVLEHLWGGPETLIVISSDLSHYLDYESARRIDAKTSRAIEALHCTDIGAEQACGRTPVRGLLTVAKKHGMHARTIDLRNSGDTAGPRDRVVGYGAYVFT